MPGTAERAGTAPAAPNLAGVLREVPESETGLVVFAGRSQTVVVAPPFPVREDRSFQVLEPSSLEEVMARPLLVGVVLLRLGRYAVAVLRGRELVGSKTGARYVKRPHRAGGSSQRRFERSRERLVRELFDKTCQVTQDVLTPFDGRIDFMLMGGEQHTLDGLIRRCTFLQRLEPVMLRRTLEVHRPGREALEHIQHQVWRSRVIRFTRDDQG